MRMSMKTWIAVAALIAEWVRDGRLRYREGHRGWPPKLPCTIAGLYRGENLGKRLIRV